VCLKQGYIFLSNSDSFQNLVRIKKPPVKFESDRVWMSEGFTLSETLTEFCSTYPPEGLGKAKNPILRTRQNGASNNK